MTEKLPTVISESEMQIAPGLTISVMVLSDGQRIIPVEDMRRACEWLGVDLEALQAAVEPAKQGEGNEEANRRRCKK